MKSYPSSYAPHSKPAPVRRLKRNKARAYTLISKALPWLLLTAMIVRTTIMVRQRSTSDFASIDLSALAAILLTMSAAIALLLNPGTKRVIKQLSLHSYSYLVYYYLICFVSSAWSLRPAYTAFRAGEVTLVLLLAFVLMSRYDNFFSAEKAFLKFSFLTIILSLFMYLRFGSFHTNLYTIIAGAGAIYCFAERQTAQTKRKRFLSYFLFFYIFFLVLGTSAASNIATLIGLLVTLALMGRKKYFSILFLFLILGILLFTNSIEDFFFSILFPNKEINDIVTMTGRKYLWEVYLNLIEEKPLIGYGFAVVSRLGRFFGTVSTTNAHNGYFEVILGTGLLGVTCITIWLFRLTKETKCLLRRRPAGLIGFIGAITVFLVNNMSKSIIGGAFDPSLVVFSLLLAFFAFHIKQRIHPPLIRRRKKRATF